MERSESVCCTEGGGRSACRSLLREVCAVIGLQRGKHDWAPAVARASSRMGTRFAETFEARAPSGQRRAQGSSCGPSR